MEYWLKETMFEPKFLVRPVLQMCVNSNCVDMFGIPTRQRDDLSVDRHLLWTNYEGSRLLSTPTLIVFAHYSSFAIRKSRLSLLICIAVTKRCILALMSFLSSALVRGSVSITIVLEDVLAIIESSMLLLLARISHALVFNVGLPRHS